jgi:hypothetical protein
MTILYEGGFKVEGGDSLTKQKCSTWNILEFEKYKLGSAEKNPGEGARVHMRLGAAEFFV